MTIRTVAAVGLGLSIVISGCSGGSKVTTPVAPSPPAPIQAAVPVAGPTDPGAWLGGTYTLTPVSLYGYVYEQTAAGPMGIGGAAVYCEVCGGITHTWATADANGFYRFPADLSTGGGVWLQLGRSTEISVAQMANYRDPPGTPIARRGPGWREVMVSGDTQFDITLVRR
jgi:hypothetical protein